MQNMFFSPRKIIFHTLYSNRFETVYPVSLLFQVDEERLVPIKLCHLQVM